MNIQPRPAVQGNIHDGFSNAIALRQITRFTLKENYLSCNRVPLKKMIERSRKTAIGLILFNQIQVHTDT